MKNIVKDLENISIKKHVVTSIEYDCKDEKQVFDISSTRNQIANPASIKPNDNPSVVFANSPPSGAIFKSL